MAKFVKILLLCICFAGSASAEPVMEKRDGAIYVESATTAEVEKLFRTYHFNEYREAYGKYPRIYLKKMPEDWKEVPENKAKHRTFIRILLPLVLKVNEAISAERALIENINNKYINNVPLNENDLKVLEEKAVKYDVFTRMKGDTRTALLLEGLLTNIDVLPPSIMIASAAAYTDWGTSRLAMQANSLYLEEVWYTDEGLKPLNDENADYRYKIFSSLEESIAAHALKINSHINYDYFRVGRKLGRDINRPPYGEQLTVHFLHDNNMRNILGLIDYTLVHYGLAKTDYFPQLVDVE
ncbi:MAG: glucosaminidase domain-containing protein [Alphaproteobacteria bacterium]|nr:glucosaminidase domain-containing protein [Alphaproteobacteria bacterium]